MPTVYKVMTDDDYQALEPVMDTRRFLDESEDSWKFKGYPLGDKWEPFEFYVRQPTLKKPDIWEIGGMLVFEPHAQKIVETCLMKAGEQFKLPFEDRELTVLNITYVIECLDKERSEIDEEFSHIIEKYVFHNDRLDDSLFMIPQTCVCPEILTVEGLASPDDEFKPLVEKHGLKGLWFKELYSWD